MQQTRVNPLAVKPVAKGAVRVVARAKPTNKPTTSAPASNPFGGVTISGSVGKPKAKKGGTVYPIIPDEEIRLEATEIASDVKRQSDQLAAVEGALKANKKSLTTMTLDQWFAVNEGLSEPHSSLRIDSDAGEVLVTFPEKYGDGDPAAIIGILGQELAVDNFEEVFKLTIDGNQLPKGERTQEFINALIELFNDHGMSQDALDFKRRLKPKKGFHARRHTLLTREQNVALNEKCPIVAMVKTKGRKK